ncbi:putative transcriptional regulator of N-Acetylglucosamine utilization, GntR family [Candidatus Burkholderia humilis]|nr:putative transcriptional regulator of N-Acetylglucosamine utilization, GntR family [Candidatus Burkholderia humilis]
MVRHWQDLTPDGHNDTPLYIQLASRLAAAIHVGNWPAGEVLPSERTLSEGVGVLRITARNAIGLLVEQGLIRRVRGAGNFITPRVSDPLSRLTGCSEMLEQRGFKPNSIWLERGVRAASRDEVVRLGLVPGASVASLRRLRRADGMVMALEHSALPAAVVPEPMAIGASLYRYLEERGKTVVRALQHFRAVNASDDVAALMGVAPQAALLMIRRIGYSADQRVIELTDSYCREDYYDFVTELHR